MCLIKNGKKKIHIFIESIRGYFKAYPNEDKVTIRMRFFTNVGSTPLKEVDFSKKDIFEMRMDSFGSSEQITNLYQELMQVPHPFDLYAIPTMVNINKDLEEGKIKKDYIEKMDTLKQHLSHEKYRYTRVFLITSKEISEFVIRDINRISFSVLGSITEEEAKEIEVC